mmetsp:Transcript_32775/g.68353  ORF Transcript_32775/g.68353 Transcript_32775/m.68353 type:complete len:527 (-) Transcript_32775:1431-3011(-)
MNAHRSFLQIARALLGVDLARAWLIGTRHSIRYSRANLLQKPLPYRLPSSPWRDFTTDPSQDSRPVLFAQGQLRSSETPAEADVDDYTSLADKDDYTSLPEGKPKGFYVVKQYNLDQDSFNIDSLGLNQSDIDRLSLTPQNISLPVALMMVDPSEYQSLSKSRKACRKGNILIHRGALTVDTTTNNQTFNSSLCVKGLVGERVFPGDIIGKQVRMGEESGYSSIVSYKKPPIDLPVVYEDDQFALVNKPAGFVVYSHRGGGHGLMTIRAVLPFALKAPRAGTFSVMRRPASVHRLDKPTSGVLCIAKTKPAMWNLSKQFHDRIIQKTYMAIVNGIPPEPFEHVISAKEAFELGVDVDPNDTSQKWNLIDQPLDERSAVTVWRAVKYARSLHAIDGMLTLVEMKPKTGRYHQLRRHMALVCEKPLVGDSVYDGGTESAMRFRDRGLFLCSTRIKLEHPTFNSPEGRKEWNSLSESEKFGSGCLLFCHETDKVMVKAGVPLPSKFESLLQHESKRFAKFSDTCEETKI